TTSSSLPYAQAHAAARAEGHAGEEADRRFGRRVEAESLGGGGEDQLGFHHREAVADADARAAAEREVGEARQALLEIAQPAFGLERRGVVEVARVAVDRPGRHHERRALREREAGDLDGRDRLARDAPRRRIEAHRLEDDGLGERELVEIAEAW